MTPEALESLRGGAKVRALVDLVVQRQRALQTLRADFTLEKTSSLLLDTVISNGEFLFMTPDQVRWDYREPTPMVVVFAGDILTTLHPEEGVAQQVKIPRKHRRFVRVLAGTQPLDELQAQFRMTLSDQGGGEPYRLTLTPIHRTLRRRLETLRLEVDRELFLPVAVEYIEADGDTTRYEFRSMEIDVDLDTSVFELELDDDIRIERIDVPE
ncbi:MAG: outer membrane lipoprotein carrier protein LolA [Thermoanaerobaculales bacterium]|nr:outer membrane lipoprotein carrier protein LolA [Thermoanaerobaculales bacterium]